MTGRSDRRKARQETVVLALLSYRRGGWSVNDLHAHAGGTHVGLWLTLERLEQAGRVRAWFEDGPEPRRRLYDVVEVGEVDAPCCTPMDEAHTLTNGHTVFCRDEMNKEKA